MKPQFQMHIFTYQMVCMDGCVKSILQSSFIWICIVAELIHHKNIYGVHLYLQNECEINNKWTKQTHLYETYLSSRFETDWLFEQTH